jgi:hypothetical protein
MTRNGRIEKGGEQGMEMKVYEKNVKKKGED